MQKTAFARHIGNMFYAAPKPQAPQDSRLYFLLHVARMSAKIARADGPVNAAEIMRFKAGVTVPESWRAQVGRAFDEARSSPVTIDGLGRDLFERYENAPLLLDGVMRLLVAVARADGTIVLPETLALHKAALGLRIPDARFQAMLIEARQAAAPRKPEAHAWSPPPFQDRKPKPTDSFYRTLGLAPDTPYAEVKRAWHALSKKYHPDMNPACDAAARMAAVNKAYQEISRLRRADA